MDALSYTVLAIVFLFIVLASAGVAIIIALDAADHDG